MNHFATINTSARAGQLASHALADIFASNEFNERTQFEGDQGIADKFAILHFMLKHIALDPREAPNNMAYLVDGTVLLNFFMFSNPVPLLEVSPQDARLPGLLIAIHENLNGPLNRAVKRVLRVRAWTQNFKRRSNARREDELLSVLRNSMTWQSGGGRRELTQEEQQQNTDNHKRMDARQTEIRHQRQSRIAMLERGTAPTIASWQDLLEKLATEVFATKH
jgi:hypothetical protein